LWKRTNLGGVVCGSENQLRSPVVTRANVRDIGLILDQNLGASEIAQLQHTSRRIKEQILGLDIPVADSLGVDVCERPEKLVDVELDFEDRHDSLHLVEVARGAVDSLGNEFEDEVEVDFVLLWLIRLAT
jgi:hypothetical protein